MEAARARWREFDSLGVEEVRKQLAAQIYGEDKAAQAREWLAHQESERALAVSHKALDASEQAVEEARSANSLSREAVSEARKANELASKSNELASKANDLARAANDTASDAALRSAEPLWPHEITI
jgi:X-X-X-Leu-X-X-Gly heptad repeat protein